jgi:hypothetical protein
MTRRPYAVHPAVRHQQAVARNLEAHTEGRMRPSGPSSRSCWTWPTASGPT